MTSILSDLPSLWGLGSVLLERVDTSLSPLGVGWSSACQIPSVLSGHEQASHWVVAAGQVWPELARMAPSVGAGG